MLRLVQMVLNTATAAHHGMVLITIIDQSLLKTTNSHSVTFSLVLMVYPVVPKSLLTKHMVSSALKDTITTQMLKICPMKRP